MSRPLILRYVELQSLLIAVIAPHWAEYMWLEVLQKPSTIHDARWPVVPLPDKSISAAREYVKSTSSNITSAEAQAAKKMAKGKNVAFDPRKPKRITIFAAEGWPAWQDKYIDFVRDMFEKQALNSADDKTINQTVAKMAKGPEMKKAMPFVQALRRQLANFSEGKEGEQNGQKDGISNASEVFERKLPFDEAGVLEEMKKGLMKTTGCREVSVVKVHGDAKGLPQAAESAVPGSPSFLFENVE